MWDGMRVGEPGGDRRRRLAAAIVGLIVMGLAAAGCESLQRKFTRKSKRPQAAPNPIVQFQDYARAMTPLDRYRKHSLMFSYWNSELVDALREMPLNGKRCRHASIESLGELDALRGLLSDDAAARLQPVLDERRQVHQRLQGAFQEPQAGAMRRELERQTRQIEREFSWRDVQDQLRGATGGGD